MKEKLAEVMLVGFAGLAVIVGAGGTIDHVHELAAPTLPAASFACTEKVCEPSARPEYAFGLVQAA